MKKTVLIIGAGPGLSQSVAERFAFEGFAIRLISRSGENLEKIKKELNSTGVEVEYALADAADPSQLSHAISQFSESNSGFDAVLYNAAVLKEQDILEESSESLTAGFRVNAANALDVLKLTYDGLKNKKGAFLMTGGGLAINPHPQYGSLSIGKAALRNLAFQLHDKLKADDIYSGMLTIDGFIHPESATHSPDVLADLFWKLYTERSVVEIKQ